MTSGLKAERAFFSRETELSSAGGVKWDKIASVQ
jgi:hypothetical protein